MNHVRKLFVVLLLVLGVQAAHGQEPYEQVERAIADLEAGLDGRREELANDSEALYDLIDDILLPRFNREYSAQLVLGRNWRNASKSQRERFIDGFYNALLRKYAEGVLEFQKDRVQLLPFKGDLEKPRVIVKTIVTLDDGQKVTVNYGFANRGGSWKMFDVTIEGISYIRNYRAELDAEIKAGDLDKVIARLESEAAGPAAPAEIAISE